MLGKTIRMNRILHQPDGRLLSVAIDHGMSLSYDLPPALRQVHRTLEQIAAGGPDSITIGKGIAKHCYGPYAGKIPLIMQAVFRVPHLGQREFQMGFLDEAVRLGADAVAMAITVGDEYQPQSVAMLAQLVREADGAGMPVIAHIYPSGDRLGKAVTSPKWVQYTARVGMEVGVDLMKLLYTGDPDSFGEIVEMSAVPVVCAGGPKCDTFGDFLKMVEGMVQAGARGTTVGRNVWGEPGVAGRIRALKAVIHEGAAPGEAVHLLE